MNTYREHKIIDVDCVKKDHQFILATLPGCLPSLYTARFRAPADYLAEDAIVVDEREYTVLTSQMEPAAANCFKSGAVVMCEIDRDRKLAFICSGGGSGSSGDIEFQTSDLVYYIDPLGDDSPNNPGGADSPFKTLTGARNAVGRRCVLTSLGSLIYSINPGVYEWSAADQAAIISATHPCNLAFRGTDPANKPRLIGQHFMTGTGQRTFENLCLSASNFDMVGAHRGAGLILKNVEITAQSRDSILVCAHSGGIIYFDESIVLDGGGYSAYAALSNHMAVMVIHNNQQLMVTVKNLPSITHAFAMCMAGNVYFPGATFTGTTTDKRYSAIWGGNITTNSPASYFPGSIAGTTETGGRYN